MDMASIVEDTERTQFCPQTDRQTTDRQTDGQDETNKKCYCAYKNGQVYIQYTSIYINHIWLKHCQLLSLIH